MPVDVHPCVAASVVLDAAGMLKPRAMSAAASVAATCLSASSISLLRWLHSFDMAVLRFRKRESVPLPTSARQMHAAIA